MPIYEYQCPKCHSIFEEWVKVSEAHGQEPCPDCGTLSPRLISHTSFVLKGGGWYVTDYGYRKGVKDEDSAPAPSDSDASSSGDSKGETKPAAENRGKSKSEDKSAAKPAATAKKRDGADKGKSAGKGKADKK